MIVRSREFELAPGAIYPNPAPAPPSRFSNPFATCWTRPGAMAYRFPDGQNAEHLIAELAANNWRGAIIGPHGSGKSTMLAMLRPLLETAGRPVHLVDGYEQLTWAARRKLHWRCRRERAGMLVASHRPTSLPTLVELKPDRRIVDRIVADLCCAIPSPITPADVADCYARHKGNVRETLFDLYDRHERLCRTALASAT